MPKKVSDAKVIESLRRHRGNRQKVAEELGYSYKNVQRRIRGNKRLQEAANEANESLLDLAEENVRLGIEIEQIQLRNLRKLAEANPNAAVTVDAPSTRNTWNALRTKGKHRGYTERSEVTGQDGETLQLVIKSPPKAESADDWMKKYGVEESPDILPN